MTSVKRNKKPETTYQQDKKRWHKTPRYDGYLKLWQQFLFQTMIDAMNHVVDNRHKWFKNYTSKAVAWINSDHEEFPNLALVCEVLGKRVSKIRNYVNSTTVKNHIDRILPISIILEEDYPDRPEPLNFDLRIRKYVNSTRPDSNSQAHTNDHNIPDSKPGPSYQGIDTSQDTYPSDRNCSIGI